jgi:hypothetical protein
VSDDVPDDVPDSTLVQIFLPLHGPEGVPQAGALFRAVREELTAAFGGLTTYARAPAIGLWQDEERDATVRDDVVVHEVMADRLDLAWWAAYRSDLERRFRQKEIMIRAHGVRRL